MAVKVRGLKGLERLLEKYQKSVDQDLLSSIGDFVIDRIQKFTVLGKSIAGSTPRPMPKYAESTKEARRNAARLGKRVDAEWFRPTATNAQLTFSGQMLRSLEKIINQVKKSIRVGPSGMRSDGLSNRKLAEYMTKGDPGRNRPPRPFIGLDDAGVQQVKRKIKQDIIKKWKKK